MRKAPCYQCEIRHVGCHSTCELYNSWKSDREEVKRQIREAEEREQTLIEVQKAKHDRLTPWMKKKR